MPELLENIFPTQRFEKKTEKVPEASERGPESFQDRRCDQRNPELVSKMDPATPEAPQRPTRAKKMLLGVPKGTSWGGLCGSPESSFTLKNKDFCMISGNESDRKANKLLTHFNENMQKVFFFNAKPLPAPPGEGPRGLKCVTVVKLTFERK